MICQPRDQILETETIRRLNDIQVITAAADRIDQLTIPRSEMPKSSLVLEQLDHVDGDIAYYEREITRLQIYLDETLRRRDKILAVMNSESHGND